MEPKQGVPGLEENVSADDERATRAADWGDQRLVEKAMPLVEAFYTGAEAQIRRHLEPLILRIADLEDEVARLRALVEPEAGETDTAADAEEYDSGDA